jgi:hypothetical protein
MHQPDLVRLRAWLEYKGLRQENVAGMACFGGWRVAKSPTKLPAKLPD